MSHQDRDKRINEIEKLSDEEDIGVKISTSTISRVL